MSDSLECHAGHTITLGSTGSIWKKECMVIYVMFLILQWGRMFQYCPGEHLCGCMLALCGGCLPPYLGGGECLGFLLAVLERYDQV